METGPPERLGELFARRYRPRRLAGASGGTVANYLDALTWWRRLAGDPPLPLIDQALVDQFAEQLAGCLAPGTVRKHLGNLGRLLAEAGVAAKVERPKPSPTEVAGDFAPTEVAALLAAGEQMRCPERPPPAAWWAAFVTVAYLHGFRCGTLLALEWAHLVGGEWQIPAAAIKGGRRGLRRPAHPQALEALEALRDGSSASRILPWPHTQRHFRRVWVELTRAAGVRQLGTHALRRSHATALAEANPEHARLSLGHSLFNTTAQHYIAGRIVGQAVLQLRLPLEEPCESAPSSEPR